MESEMVLLFSIQTLPPSTDISAAKWFLKLGNKFRRAPSRAICETAFKAFMVLITPLSGYPGHKLDSFEFFRPFR